MFNYLLDVANIFNPFKAISIGLGPNFALDDVFSSLKLLLSPWGYYSRAPLKKLRRKLGKYLGRKHVFLFESGRVAQYFLLKSLGIGRGDEVIIQAFTCVAVPNSILWTNARPVYVDVDATLNLDPKKLPKAITPLTKAVIFQYTFGNIGQIGQIREICHKHKLFLIEDCAHGLGNYAEHLPPGDPGTKEKKVGTIGDAAFFSFGRDKVISGIWGGATVLDDDKLAQKIESETKNKRGRIKGQKDSKLTKRSGIWVAKELSYPLLGYLVISLYNFFFLGKLLHLLWARLRISAKIITAAEKEGGMPEKFYEMPAAFAQITLRQLSKLGSFVEHRKKIGRLYAAELNESYNRSSSYLRFPLKVSDPEGLRHFAATHAIFLGDWYDSVVAPKGVDLEKVDYNPRSCPKAEQLTTRIVNLPTNPNLSQKDAKKVIKIIKTWQLKK